MTPSQTPVAPVRPCGSLAGMWKLFLRDVSIALRRQSDSAAAIVFFFIVVSLFPLSMSADPALLRSIAPGVIWVAALLAAMLSLSRMFADDHQDGTLEQMLLGATPLPLLVLAKMGAHWLSSGLLLALLSPLLALQFDLPAEATGVMLLSLLLGTPTLSLIGAIMSALTLGARGGGVLLALLVLPLYIPVLVFGAAAVHAGTVGGGISAHMSLLGAIFALSLFLAPWASAWALRIAVE